MKVRVAVVALASLAAWAQSPKTTIGTLERASQNEIRVKAGQQPVTFRLNPKISPPAVKTGAEISVHWVESASGELIAQSVSARQITFSASITKSDPANSEILASPKAGGSRLVRCFPATVFSASPRHLSVGQEIMVVGLEWPDGTVDATRIAIYNTDLPANQ